MKKSKLYFKLIIIILIFITTINSAFAGTDTVRCNTFETCSVEAEQGLAAAQYSLGYMYRFGFVMTHDSGEAFVKRDYAEAVKWFRAAAEQGHTHAQFKLGKMYSSGIVVIRNYAEAARWYRAAAEQGHARAQFSLGRMYYVGDGVTQDYVEAVRWSRAAAEQGFAFAQFNLGWSYRNGDGVIQDYLLAHMWLNISAANGNVSAAEARNLVSEQMSNDQIIQAQALARQCINSNYTDCAY